jgi:hypothetical protein
MMTLAYLLIPQLAYTHSVTFALSSNPMSSLIFIGFLFLFISAGSSFTPHIFLMYVFFITKVVPFAVHMPNAMTRCYIL